MSSLSLSAAPIIQHPDKPHYFYYRKAPMVLITLAEHYGAIINPYFDFQTYLQTLKKIGLNHTSVFLGDYVEGPGAFCIVNNTLAPAPGPFLPPWQRSEEKRRTSICGIFYRSGKTQNCPRHPQRRIPHRMDRAGIQ